MTDTDNGGRTFDYGGVRVTAVYSPDGRPLQACMTDVLAEHMREPAAEGGGK